MTAATGPGAMPVIQPRQMDFVFGDDIPRWWLNGDPYTTLLFAALSSSFPEGERFIVKAVSHVRHDISDPGLRRAVHGFIAQEASHGRAHEACNALMTRQGLPVQQMTAVTSRYLAAQFRWYPSALRLAKTCALEHFTAIFADEVLARPELLAGLDARMRPLWLWHAIEESEHKSVAFDVYQQLVGSYGLRATAMVLTTLEFLVFASLQQLQLLIAAGQLANLGSLRAYLRFLIGRQGLLRGLGPSYLAYYRRDFHPAQDDRPELREQGLARLWRLLGRAG